MKDNKIKPLTLEIDSELWKSFKEKTPRTITLNNKVVELIKEEVKKMGGIWKKKK